MTIQIPAARQQVLEADGTFTRPWYLWASQVTDGINANTTAITANGAAITALQATVKDLQAQITALGP